MKQKFTGLICGILALLALPAAGEDKMINYIPEQADGAVIFRSETLSKNGALQAISEAGDVKRYKKDLDWIRCDAKSAYPDMLIVIWEDSYGVMVSGLPQRDDLLKDLTKYYTKNDPNQQFSVKSGSHTGYDYISIIRNRKGKIKQYDLIYFAPATAMLMGGKNHLPWKKLTTAFNKAAAEELQQATPGDLIYGYIWNPKKLMDPLGVTRLMKNIVFQVRSSADLDDITINARAQCTSERNANSILNQMQGIGKLLLIGMFGDNQKLMTMLDQSIKFSLDRQTVNLKAFLSKENMAELRKEYENDPDMLQKQGVK